MGKKLSGKFSDENDPYVRDVWQQKYDDDDDDDDYDDDYDYDDDDDYDDDYDDDDDDDDYDDDDYDDDYDYVITLARFPEILPTAVVTKQAVTTKMHLDWIIQKRAWYEIVRTAAPARTGNGTTSCGIPSRVTCNQITPWIYPWQCRIVCTPEKTGKRGKAKKIYQIRFAIYQVRNDNKRWHTVSRPMYRQITRTLLMVDYPQHILLKIIRGEQQQLGRDMDRYP